MRLLVTGASGFIGINFILSAPRNWEIIATYNSSNKLSKLIRQHKLKNVKLVKCDLTKESDTKKLSRKVGPKPINVLYLAANSNPQLSCAKPLTDLKQNVFALVNFLENIRVGRMVFFSSGAVYDGLAGKVSPANKLNPKLPYAISKLAAEQYVKYYQKHGKIKNYVIIRFFGAYGPFEPERKIYTALINAFYVKKNSSFEVYGNGKNLIDAVYIGEVIPVVKKILTSNAKNVTVDVCLGKPQTVNQLVKTAARIFGVKKLKITHKGKTAEPITFRPSQYGLANHFGIQMKDDLEKNIIKFAKVLAK